MISQSRHRHRMRAGPILLYVVGIAFFCGMDALMKLLVGTNPTMMATFWRYAAALPFILLLWWREGRPSITREMLPVNFARAVFGSLSAVTFFWSLSVLPLAEAVTIAFVAPLLIPPLASLILKERMQGGNLTAGLIGFAGVLVAVGLDPSGYPEERLRGVGAALFAALCYALAIVLTRMRAARDGPTILSLLNALFGSLLIGFAMAATVPPGQWLPSGMDWWYVGAVGLCGAVALQLIARAYARVEAQVLAPFEYTALGWAALLGWAFFDEPVSPRTWVGAAIIAGACMWQARRGEAVPAPSSPAA
jgi:S-adenosylmethionine uptake transporter